MQTVECLIFAYNRKPLIDVGRVGVFKIRDAAIELQIKCTSLLRIKKLKINNFGFVTI